MAHRIERVNSLIRQEISELLQQQVKDPRLGNNFITVTEVITSSDFKQSKVFVSSISTEEEKLKVLAALSSASGFLRGELSRRLKLRYTPELVFHWDNSIEQGDHLLKLIDEVTQESDI
ncbi:30S ribosome-binding factor RbfA [Chloroflexota bacterium]